MIFQNKVGIPHSPSDTPWLAYVHEALSPYIMLATLLEFYSLFLFEMPYQSLTVQTIRQTATNTATLQTANISHQLILD